MGAVVEKDVKGTVQKQDQEQRKQRQMRSRIPGREAGHRNQAQMAGDLQRTLPVIALIERVEFCARHGNAIPGDLHRISILPRRFGGSHLVPP